MVKLDSIYNVRDLGGWESENGKKIRYGKIFRGSEMNGIHDIIIVQSDAEQLVSLLGITADLDLRTAEESMEITKSPLGDAVKYIRIPIDSYSDFDGSKSLKKIVDILLEEESVYIHCWGGCDRTGTVCWLLLGLLGVPEESLIKDYELSSFSIFGIRDSNSKDYVKWRKMLDSYSGVTLQNKIENYFIECGVDIEKIEELKLMMLE